MYDERGVAAGYVDVEGRWHETSVATRSAIHAALADPAGAPPAWCVDLGSTPALLSPCRVLLDTGDDVGTHSTLPGDLPAGVHGLHPVDGGPETTLIVAPTTVPTGPRGWGVAAQVYALRRPGRGIGDLDDVGRLAEVAGSHGAVAVLLSPLHAPAPTIPQQTSPYSPSSRRWLNPLLIPVTPTPAGPAALDVDAPIDRDREWVTARPILRARFEHEGAASEWRVWARQQGSDLWSYATWCVLAERHGADWRRWSADLQHPDRRAVHDLAVTDHSFAREREFHVWLQWLADRSLREVAAATGMALIADLAVGCSPDGADAWLSQDLITPAMAIGAPPDPFAPAGQDWGLPPFDPWRMRSDRFTTFRHLVRAACRGMSGLRIDHIMGLFRQFWIPAGAAPADGAYVRMPWRELLAVLRIEAAAAGCFVVGEDLGTVEDEVRHAMDRHGIWGTRVWWFDPHPDRWPAASLATVTTHDLPTVAGVVTGADGTDELRSTLDDLGPGADPVVEVHRRVAAGGASLVLVTTDDLAGAVHRPNLPGTVVATNWCRRLDRSVDDLFEREPGRSIVAAIRQSR